MILRSIVEADRQTDREGEEVTGVEIITAFKNKSHTVRRTQLLFFILMYDIKN